MAKAKRMLEEQIRLVDVTVELCDARAPLASRNADMAGVLTRKPCLLVLSKADLADPAQTREWLKRLKPSNGESIALSAKNPRDIKHVEAAVARLVAGKVERLREKGIKKTVRAMIAGIPNVGKSTLINALFKGSAARVEDRPGVTRGKQWVKVGSYLELLDTPGMLPPKLENERAALMLAFIGTIRDEIIDREQLACKLLETLARLAPDALRERLKLPNAEGSGIGMLELACKGRGWLLSGGRPDLERGSTLVVDEFRAGKMGRVTLELAAEEAGDEA